VEHLSGFFWGFFYVAGNIHVVLYVCSTFGRVFLCFFFHIMGYMNRIMLACSPLLGFFFAEFCICFSFYL